MKKNGIDVKILDFFSFGFDEKKLDQALNEFRPDIVGITGMSVHHNAMLSLARLIKKKNSALVAVGGKHATLMPNLLLKEDCIDVLFRGEADYTFPQYIKELGEGNRFPKIDGLCYRQNGQFHISEPAMVDDINTLPFPAWELTPPRKYKGSPHGLFHKGWPVGVIFTSRGCPYKCTYCAGRLEKWRGMESDRVVDEIEYLVKDFGVKEITICDNNFTLIKDRTIEICEEIVSRNLKVYLSVPSGLRIETLNDNILLAMKKAGFHNFAVGIESGSPRVQELIKKHLDLEKVKQTIFMIKSYGFYVTGFFILGFPFETEKDIKQTVDYALSLPLDSAAFTIFQAIPGSEEFDNLVRRGIINPEHFNWDNRAWIQGNPAEFYEYLTPKQVKSFQKQAAMRFFFRPRIIAGSMLRIISGRQLNTLLSAAKRLSNYIKTS